MHVRGILTLLRYCYGPSTGTVRFVLIWCLMTTYAHAPLQHPQPQPIKALSRTECKNA